MARNSGKTHRTFPAKKSGKQPTREQQSAWRAEKQAGEDVQKVSRNYTFKEVKPLNFIQGEYLSAIESNDIIFGIGSAGTGKTFIAASYAAAELYYKRINKIILTRPNVETGRGMGFLPGELDEKYAPYLQPFDQVFTRALGKGFYEYSLKAKDIDPKPLGFMRGASFEDCIILVDEAQNLTKTEFKMLLSRIGKNCKVILSGDPKQTDITDSGLLDATKRLSGIPGVEVVTFQDSDIVRSQMCKQVILAYNN
jgi:phosphate starvation-inducible PhoH-like protein